MVLLRSRETDYLNGHIHPHTEADASSIFPPPRSLHGGAEDLRDLREASEQPCHKARQSIGGSDTTGGKGRGAEAPYPLPFKGPKKRGLSICWSIGRGGCVPGWCKAGVSVGFSQGYPGVSWGIRGYPGCGRTGTPEKHVGKQALRSNWQGYPVLALRLNIILKGISEGSAPISLGSAPIGISRILRDLFPPVKETKSAQLPPPRPKTDLSPSRCIFLWADQPIKKIS